MPYYLITYEPENRDGSMIKKNVWALHELGAKLRFLTEHPGCYPWSIERTYEEAPRE